MELSRLLRTDAGFRCSTLLHLNPLCLPHFRREVVRFQPKLGVDSHGHSDAKGDHDNGAEDDLDLIMDA